MDERKGLPSSSGTPRYFKCGGAWEKEKTRQGSDTIASLLGTKRHKMIEDGTKDFADSSDEWAVERARELLVEAMDKAGFKTDDLIEEFKEKRYWLIGELFDDLMSGQLDSAFLCRKKKLALVSDYKMLFANHTEAKANEQLISNAVLFFIEHKDIEDLYVALIQPNLSKEYALTMCHFTREVLMAAKDRLTKQMLYIQKDGNPRTAGEWCTYCKYGLECKECMSHNLLTINSESHLDKPTTPEMLRNIKLAKNLLADLERREKAKAVAQLEADPDSMPGYKVTTKKSTVVDSTQAWAALINELPGITIAGAMKMSIKQLEKPYQDYYKAKNMKISLKKSREMLNEKLAHCITTTEGAPFVKEG